MSHCYRPSLMPNTRIDVADILRGIAIAGIILIHFQEQMNFFLAVAFIALQFLFCTWWMKSHKRGPFEQLWANATWLTKKK